MLLIEKTVPAPGRRLTWAVSRGVGYDGAGRDHGANDLPALAAAHVADHGPHAVLTPDGQVRLEPVVGGVATVRLGDVADSRLAVGVENDGLHRYSASGRYSACPTSGGAPTMRSVASPSPWFETWMAVPG